MSLKNGKIDLSYNEKENYEQNWARFVSEMYKIENNKISGPFHGEILKKLTCPYKHSKHSYQRFMDLSLSLPKKQSYYSPYSSSSSKPLLLEDLIQNYLGKETIEDLQCEQCKGKRTFTKESVIYSAPKFLIVHLSRFAKGWYDNEKDSREVEFPEVIDLTEKNGQRNVKFRLLGAIHHVGIMNRGHYYAWVRNGNDWFEINDEKVYSENVKAKGNISSTVYLLIFEKM